MQPKHPAPLVTMGACSPAHTHRSNRSLAHCFTYSLLVPKHSPATMQAARYSYLSLTSAGVASDLPFVTLRGNKHGLAKVGNHRADGVCCSPNRGCGGLLVKGCCDPRPPAAWICGCGWALGSHLVPAWATLAVQQRLAGFGSQTLNQEGKLLPNK